MTELTEPVGTRRRGEGETAILEAAESLFSELGFDAVSLRHVAERACVSKANIVHHFGSKEGLYVAVLRGAVHQSNALLAALAASGGDPVTRLRRYARGQLRQMFEHPRVERLILREALEHGRQRGDAIAEQVVGDGFARIVALVREGQKAGALEPAVDPALVAVVLVACKVFLFQTQGILRPLPEIDFADDPEGYIDSVMDLLMKGARA